MSISFLCVVTLLYKMTSILNDSNICTCVFCTLCLKEARICRVQFYMHKNHSFASQNETLNYAQLDIAKHFIICNYL